MIFVTVGSSEAGLEFDRLIEAMDQVAAAIEEDIIIQKGSSSYETKHARSFAYASFQEMLTFYREALFVVGHCGAGTILHCMQFKKHLIALPRQLKFGELDQDDHQLELAEQLGGHPLIQVVLTIEELKEAFTALRGR